MKQLVYISARKRLRKTNTHNIGLEIEETEKVKTRLNNTNDFQAVSVPYFKMV